MSTAERARRAAETTLTTPAPKRFIAEVQQNAADARFWVQGVIVGHGAQEYLVDDGTAVASVRLFHLGSAEAKLGKGSYIMVVGAVSSRETANSQTHVTLVAHNLINLSHESGLRMPLWWLEVAHARQTRAPS